MEEEEKKKKFNPAIEDPAPEPEPDDDNDDESTPEPDEEAAGEEDTILEGKVIEILKKYGLLPINDPAPAPVESAEDAVRSERERVSALLDYTGLVADAELKKFISDGSNVQDLALAVLASRKAELERQKAAFTAAALKERSAEPLSSFCPDDVNANKVVKKTTVNSLAAELMPRGRK